MRKILLAGAVVGLLLASSAMGQNGDLQLPDQSTLDQQAEQQSTDTTAEPGTGGTGDQQAPPTAAPGAQTPAEPMPGDQQPIDQQTTAQPGVGGAGDQAAPGCQCPNCPMKQGGAMGRGMMGPGGMMGGRQFGPRLGAISKITVENTREGAVIRMNVVDPKDLQEVQSLAKALGAEWEAMGFESKRAQQPAPATK